METGTSVSTIKETTKAQSQLRDSLANCGFFRDPAKYEPYLEGLMKSLSKRELLLGHYTHVTALTYASLGNAYRNLQEPRAVAMFRTQYRILRVLYGKTNGHISGALRELLQTRGLSSSQIVGIKKDVFHSTRHELQGDSFRRFGQRQQALLEYHKAAHIEEISFGRDNPDLAYLWRKIAHLAAIESTVTAREQRTAASTLPLLDFGEADRVGSNYLIEAKILLPAEARCCIDRGDKYFALQLYSNAVGQYSMASSTTLSALAELPKEIFDLLSLEYPREERPSSHRSRRREDPKKHRDTRSSRERKKEVAESDKQTLPTSASSLVTTLTEFSRATPENTKSETSSHTRKKRSSRTSRSASSFSSHRRPSKSHEHTLLATNDTQPSSDSYFLKLARQTRRVASSSTKVAKKHLSKGTNSSNSHEKDGQGTHHNAKPSSSRASRTSSKKESSYNTMPSPPMTPLDLGSPSQHSPQPSIELRDNTGGLLKRLIPFRKHIKHHGSPLEDIASDETATTENRGMSAWKTPGLSHGIK